MGKQKQKKAAPKWRLGKSKRKSKRGYKKWLRARRKIRKGMF